MRAPLLGFLLGIGLLVAGLFLMLVAGFLFFTIIFIPFAIIAGIIGLIMLIAGLIAAFARAVYQSYSGEVKYCPVCGVQNPIGNKYCRNCGTKFQFQQSTFQVIQETP
jgi:ribosomal protein L40E